MHDTYILAKNKSIKLMFQMYNVHTSYNIIYTLGRQKQLQATSIIHVLGNLLTLCDHMISKVYLIYKTYYIYYIYPTIYYII